MHCEEGGYYMKYNVDNINDLLEERIYVSDTELSKKIGRIKRGDVIVFNNDNVTKTMKLFEDNWLYRNKSTIMYNTCENAKIENYLYASVMETDVPEDIFKDVIDKSVDEYEDDESVAGKIIVDGKIIVSHVHKWEKYKSIVRNKKLYLRNGLCGNEYRELLDVKIEAGKCDLLIAVVDNISEYTINLMQAAAGSPAFILITNIDAMPIIRSSKVRFVE